MVLLPLVRQMGLELHYDYDGFFWRALLHDAVVSVCNAACVLVQGYPLAGVTLACFGGVLCTGAFTLLCTTFLILKKKKDRMVQEEERLEEVRNA